MTGEFFVSCLVTYSVLPVIGEKVEPVDNTKCNLTSQRRPEEAFTVAKHIQSKLVLYSCLVS